MAYEKIRPKFGKKLLGLTLFVLVLIGMGGGTVYASTSALPGDLLYPIKVNFTEELEAATKLSDQAKAEWAIERINRRLNEIDQILLVLDDVDPKIIQSIQTNVEKSGSNAIIAAQSLDSESVSKILSKLQTATESYSTTLGSIPENTTDEEIGTALNTILENVQDVEKETQKIALSFFVGQNFFPDDKNTQPKNNQNIGKINIISPKIGTQLVSGVATTIAWEPVEKARSYEVTVTHPGGEVIGLIFGQIRRTSDASYQMETSILWPADYYHGPAPELKINTLAPGYYKIKIRAEDFDGNVYIGESENFSIVAPESDRGILAVEIINQKDNPINESKVKIESQSNQQNYEATADSNGLAVINHMQPGIYNVEVIPPNSYYSARFSVYIQAGKTAHRIVRLGSKTEPLSQEYENKDDYVSPTIKVNVEDVLPSSISAKENSGKSILFARASLTPDDSIAFNRLKLGCAGDSRAFSGATLTTSNGISKNIQMRPTYGGFELEVALKDIDFSILKDETTTISLFLNVRDLDQAIASGAQYPKKISCGLQEITFVSQRTGRPISQKYFDINIITAIRALKTTLTKE